MFSPVLSLTELKSSLAQKLQKEFVNRNNGVGLDYCCHQGKFTIPKWAGVHTEVLQTKQRYSSAPNGLLKQSKTTSENLIFGFHLVVSPVWLRPVPLCLGSGLALVSLLQYGRCADSEDEELVYLKLNCFILVDLNCLQKKILEGIAECQRELLIFLSSPSAETTLVNSEAQ